MAASTQMAGVRLGVRLEALSIAWMVIEAAVGIGSGLAARSLPLTAFGIDSLIELVAGGVLLWRLSVEASGGSAARVVHAEKRASWIVGLALLGLAAYLVGFAVIDVVTRTGAAPTTLGLILAIASSVIMPFLARAKRRTGDVIGSAALRGDGACSMVCAYMAWTVVLALLVGTVFHWWWLNPLAALALVFFVVREGLEAIEAARA